MDVFNTLSAIERNSVFYANGSAWQVWNKPKNANFVYFFLIGGGGGGGSGNTSSFTSTTGGGGGGSSAITRAIFAANMLPDTLYIKIGLGGIGGISNTANETGGNGTSSHINFQPNSDPINVLLKSDDIPAAGGGGAPSSTVSGVGGLAATSWTYTNFVNGKSGLISSIGGQNGAAGTNTGGTVNNFNVTLIVTGGAGGGAVSNGASPYNGGSILGSSFLPTISAGVNDAADQTIHGVNGISFLPNISLMKNPMFFTGGGGGAPSTTTGRAGGKGGNASFGSGGGGGGGAYNGVGGVGGVGGDGLALIVTL